MEVKNPISFDEQIDKIKSRGCIIPDDIFAKMQLKRINYYRLSAYFLPFKGEDDRYKDNTSFETVFRIYEFDRKLRCLLFGIIEQIELMLRTQIAYFHSMKYGALGYEKADNFNKRHNHEKMMDKIADNNELYALIEEYDSVIDMHCIGFPDNWKELLESPNPTIRNK